MKRLFGRPPKSIQRVIGGFEDIPIETTLKHHDPKSIQRVIGGFEDGAACLHIPIDSIILALRFYNDPISPEIGVVLQVPTETNNLETYRRVFLLWPEDEELPTSFQKYIATFPFGGRITHVIEIEVI